MKWVDSKDRILILTAEDFIIIVFVVVCVAGESEVIK